MRAHEKGRKTRERIIEQATILFTRNGFKSTSLNQILGAAGIAKGGFYFHFGSKEELGMAVIESLEQCWIDRILPYIREATDAREKLEKMLSVSGDCCVKSEEQRPTILMLSLATEMAEVDEAFSARLERIFEGWRLLIEAIIEEGKLEKLIKREIDSTAVAGIVLSNILGANLFALLGRQNDVYYKQLAAFRTVLFEGISTQPLKEGSELTNPENEPKGMTHEVPQEKRP